ncbi:MAG: carbamoyltransferase C-terminal domain-containing protein [Pseudomonadota bacterium]
MTAILGITAFHAGASACLVIDGVPVFAIAEERINRVKYFGGFPTKSIQACLDFAGLKLADIDHVALGRDPGANKVQKAKYALSKPSQLGNFLSLKKKTDAFANMKQTLAEEFQIDPTKLKFQIHNVEHHVAHTASSYFISPWEKCTGLSVDGSGDFVSTMITACEGDEIKVLDKTYLPTSLGTLYTMVCEFIGYDRYGDEGKVMGLAPYGNDTYGDLFEEMVTLSDDGFALNPKFFVPFGSNPGLEIDDEGNMVLHRHYSDEMVKRLGEPRKAGAEYLQRDMDLAFNLQKRFEEVYLHMANKAHTMAPDTKIALSGGCALNSVANGMIFDHTSFEQTEIQPAAGDDGLSMGAALHVSNAVLKEGKRFHINDPYFGDEFSDEAVEKVLKEKGVSYRKCSREDLIETAAETIANGKVMGWFQGRMEWGPRALGNRSILVHPGYPGMKDILNERIKRREWFRPFAPAVLEERQNDIFEQSHPSPFMLHVYKIRKEWREKISAVNHEDNTGRLQTVKRVENPLYYDLISAFEKHTGVPVLLNTSFNENEPIVHTPEQAVDCFLRTKMDVLGIGSFWCVKEGV